MPEDLIEQREIETETPEGVTRSFVETSTEKIGNVLSAMAFSEGAFLTATYLALKASGADVTPEMVLEANNNVLGLGSGLIASTAFQFKPITAVRAAARLIRDRSRL